MSAAPPQLHLSLSTNTSFKRSFEQFGFDLESPVGGPSSDVGSSNSSSSSGESERNKRARSTSSYEDSLSASGSSSTTSAAVPERPPRLPTPEIQDMDIDIATNSELELPRFPVASPLPLSSFASRTDPPEDVRNALQRFNDFDSHIDVLRRSPRSESLTRTTTPPPILPPLSLDVASAPTLPPLPQDHSPSLGVPFLAEPSPAPSSDTIPQLPVPTFLSSAGSQGPTGFSSVLDNPIRPSSPLRMGPSRQIQDIIDEHHHDRHSEIQSALRRLVTRPIPPLLDDDDDEPLPARPSSNARVPSFSRMYPSRPRPADILRDREERWERINSLLDRDDDDHEREGGSENPSRLGYRRHPPGLSNPAGAADWRGRYVENGLVDPPDAPRSNLAPRIPFPSSLTPPSSLFNNDQGPSSSLLADTSYVSSLLSRARRANALERERSVERDRERDRRRRISLGFMDDDDGEAGTRTRSPVLPPLAMHTSSFFSQSGRNEEEESEDETLDGFMRFRNRLRNSLLHGPDGLERNRAQQTSVEHGARQARRREYADSERLPTRRSSYASHEPPAFTSREASPPLSWSDEFARAIQTSLSTNREAVRGRRPMSWTSSSSGHTGHFNPLTLPPDLGGEASIPNRLENAPPPLRRGFRSLRVAPNFRMMDEPDDTFAEEEFNRPPTIPLPDLGESPFREESERQSPAEGSFPHLFSRSRPFEHQPVEDSSSESIRQPPWLPLRPRRRYPDLDSYIPPPPVRNRFSLPHAPGPDGQRNTEQGRTSELQQPPTIPPLPFEESPFPRLRRDSGNVSGERERERMPPSSSSYFRRVSRRPSVNLLGDEPERSLASHPDGFRASEHRTLPLHLPTPTLTELLHSRRSATSNDSNNQTSSADRVPPADMHLYLNRHIRIEASRLETPNTGTSIDLNSPREELSPARDIRSSGDYDGLNHALEVLRGDGLSERRHRQLVSRFQHDRRTQEGRADTGSDAPSSHRRMPTFGEFQRGARWAERPAASVSTAPTFATRRAEFFRRTAPNREGASEASRADALLRGRGMLDFLGPSEFGFGGRRRSGGFSLGDFMRDEDFDTSYESLLSLGSFVGEVRPRGTPDHVVAGLDKAFYKDWATKDSDQRCPICLDDYKPSDPVLKLPNCRHWLHRECLEQWLKGADTCPVCRKAVACGPGAPPRPHPRHRYHRSPLRPSFSRRRDDNPPGGGPSSSSGGGNAGGPMFAVPIGTFYAY